jgi:methionyl aminopeptidase
VNHQVVHGIPSSKVVLQDGDIVSVDCGVILNKYHGDSAFTFQVGDVAPEVKDLLEATRASLFEGIRFATTAWRMGDLGSAIQSYCEERGYSVVRELIGHGVGTRLHEPPDVPNYGRRGVGMKLKKNMVICIEPMINMGVRDIYQGQDGWTISTRDHKPSAHFELMVVVGDKEAETISTFSYIDQILN